MSIMYKAPRGALYMMDMDPILLILTSVLFNDNVATYGKGALIESNNALVKLLHCTVSHNTAVECGAIAHSHTI